MFWIIILCHLIADYPLQTDAMVMAKKTLTGLIMHVSVHFLTMIVVLCGILGYDASSGMNLAIAVSGFHLAIDQWKNVLTGLRPEWVVFTYLQDQFLHVLSILLVTGLWKSAGEVSFIAVGDSMFVYAAGFVLSTHTWFVTEKVLSFGHSTYQRWVTDTMWPRMMCRAILYSLVIVGFNFWAIPVIVGAIIVGWNDLDAKIRFRTIGIDLAGVFILIALTGWVAG